MNVLYWDCSMGAAGDMLAAGLWELCPDRQAALAELNALDIPGVEYIAEPCVRGGVTGTHLRVLVHGMEEQPDGAAPACVHAHDHEHTHERCHEHEHTHEHEHCHEHEHSHDHEHTHEHEHAHVHGHTHEHEHTHTHGHSHAHHSLADIASVIAGLHAPEAVKADALRVYQAIAAAEGQVHGHPVDEVHFHEVGALDAVADVAAVCWLLHRLAPGRVCASPIQVGGGTVRCAHGVLPVPAPATALLLQGLPIQAGAVQTELCTPTGAALLKCFVTEYGPMPAMRLAAVGHGCGQKDFPGRANCVTAFWGEAAEVCPAGGPMDEVSELRCNLDDMSPEAIGYAQQVLLAAGARDVFTTPIGMKKDRPAVMLTCLCAPEREAEMAALLLRHTTTLGVRVSRCDRYTLARSARTAQTPWGPVRVKTAEGWGVSRRKAEYDDLARIAQETGLPLEAVRREVEPYL